MNCIGLGDLDMVHQTTEDLATEDSDCEQLVAALNGVAMSKPALTGTALFHH
jgi:hypothetical protein